MCFYRNIFCISIFLIIFSYIKLNAGFLWTEVEAYRDGDSIHVESTEFILDENKVKSWNKESPNVLQIIDGDRKAVFIVDTKNNFYLEIGSALLSAGMFEAEALDSKETPRDIKSSPYPDFKSIKKKGLRTIEDRDCVQYELKTEVEEIETCILEHTEILKMIKSIESIIGFTGTVKNRRSSLISEITDKLGGAPIYLRIKEQGVEYTKRVVGLKEVPVVLEDFSPFTSMRKFSFEDFYNFCKSNPAESICNE